MYYTRSLVRENLSGGMCIYTRSLVRDLSGGNLSGGMCIILDLWWEEIRWNVYNMLGGMCIILDLWWEIYPVECVLREILDLWWEKTYPVECVLYTRSLVRENLSGGMCIISLGERKPIRWNVYYTRSLVRENLSGGMCIILDLWWEKTYPVECVLY